jgi:hypothetical protein
MKTHLELIAQKFCLEYFTNAKLDSQQFILKVNELVTEVGPIEEKLTLLNEVIRIGKLYCHSDGKLKNGLGYFDFYIFPTAN